MATSFFPEISCRFKRILSKEISLLDLDPGNCIFCSCYYILKMVILYFWHFLVFCFQCFFSVLFTTPKHRHHSFAACFEEKQENEKNIIIKVVKKS